MAPRQGGGWRGRVEAVVCHGASARQFELETGTGAGARVHPDPAVHQGEQPPADRQAQTGAAELPRGRGIHLAERAEQSVLPVSGDADACVPDRSLQQGAAVVGVAPRQLHTDLPLGREFHGIADQVDQHLAQARAVTQDVTRHLVVDPVQQVHTLVPRSAAAQVEGALQAVADVDRHAFQIQLAGFEPGEIQDAIDQGHQGFAAGADDLGKLLLLCGQRRLQQQVAHADHRIHRRADLVAHVGQELGFGAMARIGCVACGDQVGLGLLACGDVARNAQQARAAPPLVAHGHLDQFVVLDSAGLTVDQAVFIDQRGGAGHGQQVSLAVADSVAVAEQLLGSLADNLLVAEPMLALVGGVGQEVHPVGVLEPYPVGDVVDQCAEHGLLARQRLLRLHVVGDVGVGAHRAAVGQGAAADLQRPALARAAHVAAGGGVVGGGRVPGLDDAGQKRPVVRGGQSVEFVAEIAASLLPQHQFVRGGLPLHQVRRQVQQLPRLLVVEDATAVCVEAHDALADVFQRDGQRVRGALALGDVLHRAFVEHRAAIGARHQAGVLPDPDAFPGAVAVDLRNEVLHLAVRVQLRAEFFPPPGLHVPLATDVVDGGQHFGFGCEAVDADQRRIGPQLAPLQAAAVGAQGQPVKEGGKVVVRHGGRSS